MATPALRMCTNEKCGHANGEPCGQPVQTPVTVQQAHSNVPRWEDIVIDDL
jgi:hypothetical protein